MWNRLLGKWQMLTIYQNFPLCLRCVLSVHSLAENVAALLWEGRHPAVAKGTTVSGRSPIFIKHAWYLWHLAKCIASLDNRTWAENPTVHETWACSFPELRCRYFYFSKKPQWNEDQITFLLLFRFAFLIACSPSQANFLKNKFPVSSWR